MGNNVHYSSLYRLNTVPRWAIVPTIKTQSVAEHTFNVMWIANWLTQFTAGVDPHKLLFDCMVHDADEAFSGDTPSTHKPRPTDKDIASMSRRKIVLKVADGLEALVFLAAEEQFGNKRIESVMLDVLNNVDRYCKHFPWRGGSEPMTARAFFHELLHEINL